MNPTYTPGCAAPALEPCCLRSARGSADVDDDGGRAAAAAVRGCLAPPCEDDSAASGAVAASGSRTEKPM